MVYTPREDSFLLQKVVKQLPLRNKKVMDMGTGTGIIAITARQKQARVTAVDIDKEALKSIKDRSIKKIHSDLFNSIPKQRFHYIFFNAPYLPRGRSIDEDNETIGGKHGYETINRFISQLNQYLEIDGEAYIVYSSLSKPERIQEQARNYLLDIEIVASQRIFFETIMVARLKRNNINKELFRKGFIINGLLGKGKHSIVYKVSKDKEYALKIFKYNYEKEVDILSYLNKTNAFFAPKLFMSNNNYLIEELVKGETFATTKRKRLMAFLYLLAARQLDIRNISKQEMHMPQKHVFLGEKFRIIDYERSIFTDKPNSFTQAMQFITHYLNRDIKEFKELLKKYKSLKEPRKEEVFIEIMKELKLTDLYNLFALKRDINNPLLRIVFPNNLDLRVLQYISRHREIITYSDLSKEFNIHPRSVAKTLSKNPLLITIPCHLVVSKKDIGGYVLGKEKKKSLLL